MYEAAKVLHILAWTSWMAGLFYLPRILVYHAERANRGGETAETFKVMEDKLLRLIMTPAMVVTWATGLYLAASSAAWSEAWLWVKVALVVAMTGFHHMLKAWMRAFAADANVRSGRFFRFANEVPTLIFVFIVILAIVRPF